MAIAVSKIQTLQPLNLGGIWVQHVLVTSQKNQNVATSFQAAAGTSELTLMIVCTTCRNVHSSGEGPF